MTRKVVETQWNGTDFFTVGMMYQCLTADQASGKIQDQLLQLKSVRKGLRCRRQFRSLRKARFLLFILHASDNEKNVQMFFRRISGWNQYKWEIRRSKDLGLPFSQCPINNCFVWVRKRKFGKRNAAFLSWKEKKSKWYWPEPQGIKEVTKVNIRNTE